MDLVAFRWADYDTPFWVSPNRFAGRFHRVGDGPTQYWSLHPLTPWAELLRHTEMRRAEAMAELRHRVWVARVALADEDLAEIGFGQAEEWGIAPEALVDDDFGICQELGARVRLGHRALVTPSAALPGTRSLVLFGPMVAAPYGAPPLDPAIEVPASPTADGARPPSDVLALVRWRGSTHAELHAWHEGHTFELAIAPHAPGAFG